ncbi:MAG: polysaccharide biosynthesis tyrosine autokinase [Desulfobacteraceae bacterium]|nr:polysaccharide biosynthesis tyrosine autokinase [Desulfobacteraceae bacterium]
MDEKEIHLRDYFRIVNKRKSTVFTFFTITFIIVVISTFTATPIYMAATKVMVEKNTSNALGGGYRYTPYDPEFLETQYQIIKSASVTKKVVDGFDVEKMYNTFFSKDDSKQSIVSISVSWLKSFYLSFKEMIGIEELASVSQKNGNTPVSLTKAEELERFIQMGVSVQPVQNSRVIEISFKSDNPALAAKISNSIARAYIDELLDMRMETSSYSIRWMSKKAETQRKKLEDSEKSLTKYQKDNDIITIEDRMTVLPERLSELSRRLTKSETDKKELGAIYNQIRNTKRRDLETIPAIADNRSIDSIKKQIIVSEQKISEFSKKYGRKHPVMISANDELKGLKRKKTSEIQKAVQTIQNQYELAISNEQNLRTLLNETKFEATNLNEKYIQLKILKREVETNRYLYDALVKKMKEKGLTEENQSVNVWVIEKAVIPEIPASPNKKRNLLLAIILGLFGGIGLAFFFEYLDNTVKTPEDIEDRFDIAVIGTIGLFKSKKETVVENILNKSKSPLSENFKSLRTSVLLSSADRPPKTFLVTSMSPGEGKSSVSASLAAIVAETGKKTLLIDADMRRPVQHNNFGIENSVGLSSFLAGVTAKGLIHRNVKDKLDIMGSGPVPPNPSELLSSERFIGLVTRLYQNYDMIIIDSPPLISVSDALIISRNVEGTIIVSSAGSTTYEMLNKGLKLFNENASTLTGLVINKFDARKSGYYYGYGDYYYSSSSQS